MKRIIGFILCKILKKKMVLVKSIFPLEYIVMDDIQITGKGMMYLEYISENPEGTMEEFEEIYNKMF